MSEAFIRVFNYMPTVIFAGFDIGILILGNFMYKRNSYKYGKFLMISAIISLVSAIIYIAIDYQYLSYNLYMNFSLNAFIVNMIMLSVSTIFFGLNTASAIFLILALHKIYETHRKSDRTEIELK
ncbi:MAG: hypothetical protein ACXAEX_07245 [Promethearchaeota archaeon]